MSRFKLIWWLTPVLVILLAGALWAETIEDSPEVVSMFAKGKRLLREGDFLEASRIFEELAGRFPQSENLDLFVFNRAKADYYFGNYNKALAGFSSFRNLFSESPLVPYAVFFQANIYYIKGNLDQAFKHYLLAYSQAKDARLMSILEKSILATLENASSVSIGRSDFEVIPRDKRCQLTENLSDELVRRKNFKLALDVAAVCGRKLDIKDSPDYRASLVSDDLEIAMVLPLSGELQSFGEDIYNGAVIAADFFRRETGKEVKLSTHDTEGDPINAARLVRDLEHTPVDLVVGPLTSEAASVTSAVLNCSNLPLIAPAATQAGLTQLNETSFQLSPNIELQGIQMADYAVMNLGADSAAIITSTTTEHLRMARAFSDRFKELGGKIVAVEYYRSRDKDFSLYIKDIKAALLGAHPDSVYFINEYGDTLESDGVPADIDCLYLPGNSSQLRLLLEQLNFYNLNAQYLGSDGWGEQVIYRLGDNNTKGAVFPSPFMQGDNETYLKFAAAYDTRFGGKPSRLAALGFDAVWLGAKAFLNNGQTREAIVNNLASVSNYDGAAGKVTFGLYRENVAMPIYRIENGQAVLLGIGESVMKKAETGDF